MRFISGGRLATWRIPRIGQVPVAYGLFIASAALLFLGTRLLKIRAATTDPVLSIARDKVNDFVHVVPVIIALTLVTKDDLKSIFMARGNLKEGPVLFSRRL